MGAGMRCSITREILCSTTTGPAGSPRSPRPVHRPQHAPIVPLVVVEYVPGTELLEVAPLVEFVADTVLETTVVLLVADAVL